MKGLLVCCLALVWHAAAEQVHTVRNIDEFNELLQEAADGNHKEFTVRFSGELHGKHIRRIMDDCQWPNHCRAYQYTPLNKTDYSFKFTYMDSTRMLAAHRNPKQEVMLSQEEMRALEKARQRIKQSVSKGMSDLEIVRALHDSLVNDVSYDKKSGPNCTTMLLKHKGVCDAYSRCMYLMLNMLNIPCHMVVGKAKGEAHAWNLVQLERGEWYHVDATWDDPCMPGKTSLLRHTYFCLSDDEIRSDHKWNARQYPATPKEKGYFYQHVNRYFQNYDDFWADAQRAFDAGDVSYSAYLACYGSARKFNKSFKEYQKNGGSIGLAGWAPPADKQNRVVSLTFNNKKKKPDDKLPQPDDDSILPTEPVPSWLSGDMWTRVSNAIDMDAVVKEGSKMLLKGINSVEEMADDYQKTEGGLQEKGKAVWDGLLNKMKQ